MKNIFRRKPDLDVPTEMGGQRPQKVKQKGVTLMELIAAVAVMSTITAGSITLYTQTSAAEKSLTLQRDVVAVREAIRKQYNGRSNYGIPGSQLLPILVVTKSLPSTVFTDASPRRHVLTHSSNATLNAYSTGPGFILRVGSIDTAMCIDLMTGASGWTSVQAIKVGLPPARTSFPVSPEIAASDCANAMTVDFNFVGS